MLEHFFVRPSVISRLRGGPLGHYLDDLATILHQHRCAPDSIRGYLRTTHQFRRWLSQQGYAVAEMDATLPQRLTAEEVERVLAMYTGGTPKDRRNHAILRLLARLGLRPTKWRSSAWRISICVRAVWSFVQARPTTRASYPCPPTSAVP